MFPPFLVKSFVAGIIASFACGLGALLLLIRGVDPEKHTGIAYAAAGGLMFAASVYNLILPGLSLASTEITLDQAIPVITGILLGALFYHRLIVIYPRKEWRIPAGKDLATRHKFSFLLQCLFTAFQKVLLSASVIPRKLFIRIISAITSHWPLHCITFLRDLPLPCLCVPPAPPSIVVIGWPS